MKVLKKFMLAAIAESLFMFASCIVYVDEEDNVAEPLARSTDTETTETNKDTVINPFAENTYIDQNGRYPRTVELKDNECTISLATDLGLFVRTCEYKVTSIEETCEKTTGTLVLYYEDEPLEWTYEITDDGNTVKLIYAGETFTFKKQS